MGLTENTATALLALNGLDVLPNSAVTIEGTETGLVGSARITCDWLAGMVVTGAVDGEEAPDMAHEFAYGLAKRAYGFQKETVGRA